MAFLNPHLKVYSLILEREREEERETNTELETDPTN